MDSPTDNLKNSFDVNDHGYVNSVIRLVDTKAIDAHPVEDAIIVTFELKTSLDSVYGDAKECQKIIRLKNFKQLSDMDSLADEIIRKSSNLLSRAQLSEVKRILHYLKNRNASEQDQMKNVRPKTSCGRESKAKNVSTTSQVKEININPIKDLLNIEQLKDVNFDQVSLSSLNDYCELLYEDIDRKIQGVAYILKLAESSDNLEMLEQEETLLSALVRIFREEGRKSLELSSLLIGIFACFSVYTKFHSVVSQYKMGSLCLDVIKYQLEREEMWYRELSEINAKQGQTTSMANSMVGMSTSNLSVSSAPPEMNRGNLSPTFALLPNDYEKSLKKYQSLVRRQNLLLKTAYFLLLNLSEDKKVEIKMVNKGIVDLLVKSLEREATPAFFTLVVILLKKLSIYVENKDKLQELKATEKLTSLLATSMATTDNTQLVQLLLGLLLNLSFDLKLRNSMAKSGILQKLILLLSKDWSQDGSCVEQLALQILYHMSRDDKVKELFGFPLTNTTNSIGLPMTKVIRYSDNDRLRMQKISIDKRSPRNNIANFYMELMSLVINLAVIPNNSRAMCEQERLPKLLEKAIGNLESVREAELHNVLLMKLIRNISQHDEDYKAPFAVYAEKLMKLVFTGTDHKSKVFTLENLQNSGDDDMSETLVVECLGTLGNLPGVKNIDWLNYLQKFNAIEWMKNRLKSGSCSEDDQILEIAIFIGTCCMQLECASYLIEQDILKLMIDLLNAKQEDDEIVLQVIFVFQVLIGHEETRNYVIKHSQVPAYLIDLMNDKNKIIKEICSSTLDLISECDAEWMKRIQMEKFKAHNKQWIEMVQSSVHVDDVLDEFGDDCYSSPVHQADDEYSFFRPEMLNSSLDSDDSNHSANDEYDMFARNGPTSRQPSFGTSRPQTGYKRRTFVQLMSDRQSMNKWPVNCHASVCIPRCADESLHGQPIFMPIRSRIDLSANSSPSQSPVKNNPLIKKSDSCQQQLSG